MKKGYMAIVTVLVLLAVTVGIASSMTLFSIDRAQGEDAFSKGQQALQNSESCAEEGLLRTIHDSTYNGGNFQIPQGECQVSVENNSGTYTMHALGKNDAYQKEVSVDFTIDTDRLSVINWKEQ